MNHFKVPTILLSLSLWMPNANAFPTLLLNFEQLVKAVERGDDVKAIIHFDKCLTTNELNKIQIIQNSIGASTRFNFTEFSHYTISINGQVRDTVVTTLSDFIERPSGDFFRHVRRLNVFEDNSAVVHLDYIDPLHNKLKYSLEWNCDISNGKDTNGLLLYDNQ